MKNRIINAAVALAFVGGIESPANASDLFKNCNKGPGDLAMCVISAPTWIVMVPTLVITSGLVDITMSSKMNEAVIAAQEPAFLILNNQADSKENPLFQNAVTQIKDLNPNIKNISDEEMASIILQISDQIGK